MARQTSRRQFVKQSAAIGAAVWVGGSVRSDDTAANSRVRYACIGVGGKGGSDSGDAAKFGDVVAICDIDDSTLDKAGERPGFEKAAKFNDFRKMLEEKGNEIDAVTVSTPDHCHAPAAAMAMSMGKACFVQKPLTHTVCEARRLQDIAREMNVATMMGNQGTANSGLREAAAILKGQHLGNIKEVHVFTNRPVWPQGIGRPQEEEAPPWVHWDLWLGPAASRGFSELYHPFKWRGWWDFGTGALGDMACHTFNMPFMGVELKDPTAIQAWTTGHDGYGYPQKSKIKFDFPKNDWRGDVAVWWYDGGNLPDESVLNGFGFKGDTKNPRGTIVVCEGGTLYSWEDYGADFTILDGDGKEIAKPKVDYEKSPGHFQEWHQSIIGERERATSNFENYAGPLTETILLGNLAVWAAKDANEPGKRIEWDAKTLTATNAPEVMDVVNKSYREGWDTYLKKA
ncbi:MAG: Gfo/Idh/MocA family oxidoreductase [Planctomycetaceae bacterium]